MYQTKEGLWVHDKGEEGVREQQRDYKYLVEWVKTHEVKRVWDLGAHVGWFTWYLQQHCKPDRILCVEPSPNQLECLRKNVQVPFVKIVPRALTSNDGASQTNLYLGKTYSSCNSVFEVRGRKTITVPTIKMSELSTRLSNPDVVKVDIEGAEYLVNWYRDLPKSVNLFMTELHHHRKGHDVLLFSLCHQLERLGFKAIKGPKLNSYKKTCTVIYVRE